MEDPQFIKENQASSMPEIVNVQVSLNQNSEGLGKPILLRKSNS